jgi:hypothetical protein
MALDEEVEGWLERAIKRELLLLLASDVTLSWKMGRGDEGTGEVERGELEQSDQPRESRINEASVVRGGDQYVSGAQTIPS